MNLLNTLADTSLWIVLPVLLVLVCVLLLIAFLVLRKANKNAQAPQQLERPELGLAVPQDGRVAASFRSALQVLRGRVMGGSFQYRVPWILLIGTPGSGKTSILDCLASAALPLGQNQPRDDKGIAWGFLNNGVLIDIPGSLLLGPNPGVASNESGWNQLLRRLTRHRPARPLDGVVLTISADELLDEKTDITVRGSLIRAKLDQLQSAIGLVLPVYVLVTRCDRVRGFEAWCAELDQSDPDLKKEIFGWSNSHTLESVFTWVWADEAMNTIARTLRRHQLGFFGAPRALASADDLYLFPPSMDALRDPLRTLLTQLFTPVSYRDAHYFRGVYFSGQAAGALQPGAGTELVAASSGRSRLPLAFLNHLFEQKIFVEKNLARPVPQRFFFKNRVVLSAQIFAGVFSLIMAVGLAVGWNHLTNRHKSIYPAITEIGRNIHMASGPNGVVTCPGANVDSAYQLLQALAYVHASGFWSVFMPTSWNDPIEGEMETTLADAFKCIVLNSFKTGLEQRYGQILSGVGSVPVEPTAAAFAAAEPAADRENALLNVQGIDMVPMDNQRYQTLQLYLTQLAALERHIAAYNNLRVPGSGSINNVREILQYLTGKTLPGDEHYLQNVYFSRAIGNSTWEDLSGIENDRKAAAERAKGLVWWFYFEWFDRSPLRQKIQDLKYDVSTLAQAPEFASDLRKIAGEITELDTVFSVSSSDWLEQPFTRRSYAALAALDDPALAQVISQDFKDQRDVEGRNAWLKLRAELLSESAGQSGPMLETAGNDRIQIASPIRALGSQLTYLSNLDFMASSGAPPLPLPSRTPVFWNSDMLADALKLNASWEKYQREVLSSVPGSMQSALKRVAQRGLGNAMADIVARAQTPLTTNTAIEDPMTAELKNFDQSLGQLRELQSIGEKLGDAGKPLITSLNLYTRAIRLLGGINTMISSNALYSWQKESLQKWDGAKPLSQVLYDVETPADLADAIAVDHDRLRKLVEAADPIVQLISAGGLPVGDGKQPVYWGRLGADFKQFGDKRPGNPIAALEGFLGRDVDKIVPENRCQGGASDPRAGDPFIEAMNGLRTDAVRACLLLVRQHYNAIADDFTRHLAGKFPFSDRTVSAEADPNDVAGFFDLYNQNSPGLIDSLDRLGALDAKTKPATQNAVSFLRRIAAIQPLFATADKTSVPALDVTVQFRSNQTRERGGDQIIDWDLRIGDQVAQYQSASRPVRWHYGDRLTLSMRYAKDSPNVPVATENENDLQIGDRKIVYDYRNRWSLFALMLRHPAAATDFDNPLAPLPNTIRIAFGNAPGTPGTGAARLPDTVVYVTFNLQSPAARDAPAKEGAPRNAVVVSGFPASAPAIR